MHAQLSMKKKYNVESRIIRTAFKITNYSRTFCPGSMLLFALVIMYRDPRRNDRDHFAFLNAALVGYDICLPLKLSM